MVTILLVEDDKFLIRVYKSKFEQMGYIILSLEDGEKVYEFAKEKKPDVIILDIVMPKKDGFQVLRELKGSEHTEKIPVIILTSLQSESDQKKAADLGALKFITKSSVNFNQVVDETLRVLFPKKINLV
ncbi:MAG: response regulator [Candidatus Pacebacteria bacterium CG10_big_fil_rev_8_21_14_0_10_42_12]|nr:response regulator [Candidatus Parcubacteria bacterium]NCS66765.1 response regulator [Candidatus Peregrinibacteria bacterium]PIR62716.1 MAG: response regulator [Candidatus Pacebacteria bacterium CG10_big_fil_rev_8_21_14_0_10_42_12]